MATLLHILFLISLICFLLGLLKPAIFNFVFSGKSNRKQTSWLFGICFLFFFFLDSIQSEPEISLEEKIADYDINSPHYYYNPPAIETTPDNTATDEENAAAIVNKILEGNNNLEFPYVKDIRYNKTESGSVNLFISYNADDNFTSNFIKGGIETKMTLIYKSLFNCTLDINSVVIKAYYPKLDKYGNAKIECRL